jgi:4-hydroxyphenylacetate 3-monooxygenase
LIGSHNLLATPAEADFDDVTLKPLLARYLRGADDVSAKGRARLFRTAWDMVGSALGGRVELYERFYLASASRNYSLAHMMAQRQQDWQNVPEFWAATDKITGQYNIGDNRETKV